MFLLSTLEDATVLVHDRETGDDYAELFVVVSHDDTVATLAPVADYDDEGTPYAFAWREAFTVDLDYVDLNAATAPLYGGPRVVS